MRDRAHRKPLYPKLAEAAQKMGTDFFMIPGDMVSYSGERWLLLDTTGSPNQPMTARIQQATHADAVAEKVVRYDTLKPLASMREQHLYQLELEVAMSSFIFYMKAIEIVGKLRDMVCKLWKGHRNKRTTVHSACVQSQCAA